MPDGTAPPGLSWRGTAFLMPYSLERWAPAFGPAADLSRRVRDGLEGGRLPSPATVDDRYAAHLFLPSFVDAQFARDLPVLPCVSVTTPCREPAGPEDGGLRAFSRDTCDCVLQARTGSVSVFSRKIGRVVLNGPAYRLKTPRGTFRPAPSEDFRFSDGPEYFLDTSFRKILGEGGWARLGAVLLPAIATMMGRIHHGTPGRLDAFVRRYAFGTGREAPVSFRRSITVSDEFIRIRDSIAHRSSTPRGRLHCTFRGVPSLHPSSGFFTRHELDGPSAEEEGISEAVRSAWESGGAVDLEIDIGFDPSGIRLRCRVNGIGIGEEAPLAGLPG